MSTYQITDPSPKNTARDMSASQDFSFVVQGKATDYQLIIMNNSTSAVLYDTTKITLATPWYNNTTQTVTIPSGSVANDLELKWTLQTWDGTDTVSSLEEIFFYSYGDGVLSLTVVATITEQSNEFAPSWTQAEGLSVQKYQAFLYDVSENIIAESEVIESENVVYTFDGFIDGTTYGVSFIAYDEFDRSSNTGIQSFEVDYSQPNINITPSATVNNDTSGIIVSWGEAVIINGIETTNPIEDSNLVVDGFNLSINGDNLTIDDSASGDFTYIDDWIYSGNTALKIPNVGNLYYDIDIPVGFTVEMTFSISSGFSGVIATMDAGGYDFGYDGSKFYVNIGGVIKNILTTTVLNKKWYVGLLPTSTYIEEIT